MNGYERVMHAIRFERPDRIPVWMMNKDQRDGDILWYDLRLYEDTDMPGSGWHRGHHSEWGYVWRTLDDGTMGQPTEPVIRTWDELEHFRMPGMDLQRRFSGLNEYMKASEGYYRLPMCIVNGFTTYTFLRGFENAMVDFIEEPEKSGRLLDRILSWEMELMEHCAKAGFHGFHLGDDWGTQRSLIISPGMWREVFFPRYKKQCEHAHKLGLQVWFHSCGNVTEIAEGLFEAGVDVLNLAQPNTVDIEKVGRQLKGKQCFLIPISYQTTSISGSHEEILSDAKRMYDMLGSPDGGFIGYVEEYSCMGMTDANYHACIEAFRRL